MNKFRTLLVVGIGSVVLLSGGCVSKGNYETIVKERDELAKQNRALQSNMKVTRNEKTEVPQQLDETSTALAITSDQLAATEADAITTEALYAKLTNDLSSELESQQITIQQMQSGVNLQLPEAILFDSGSAEVKSSGAEVLNKVAQELEGVPYQTIVAGFTDNVPISKQLATKFPSNWDLAAARATNVVRTLQNSGVPGQQLVVVSFGDNQPVASNDTPEGRAQNRRIEIRLRPVVAE